MLGDPDDYETLLLKIYENQIFQKEDTDIQISRSKNCYNWRDIRLDIFTRKMLNLFEDSKSADVKFLVGPNKKEIACHKGILNLWSPSFAPMWDPPWTECSGIVTISHHSYEAFFAFIKCLYTDVKYNVPIDFELECFKIAHAYMIVELFEKLGHQLVQNVRTSNAVEYFQAGCVLGHKSLESSSCEVILKWLFAKVMNVEMKHGEEINEDDFVPLESNLMARILLPLLKILKSITSKILKNEEKENKIKEQASLSLINENVQNFLLRWACLKCVDEDKEINIENFEKILFPCLNLLVDRAYQPICIEFSSDKFFPKIEKSIETIKAGLKENTEITYPKNTKISKLEWEVAFKVHPINFDIGHSFEMFTKEFGLLGMGFESSTSRDVLICNKFWNAAQTERVTDIRFKVGHEGIYISCHSIVLLAWSPYFVNLASECKLEEIYVLDESPTTFKSLKNFLYTGRFAVHESDALELLRLSVKWEIVELSSIVSKYIASELIRVEKVVDIYNLAKEVADNHLERIAFDFIYANLLKFDVGKLDVIQRMGSDLISKLLEYDSNVHDETQLFMFLERWRQSQMSTEMEEATLKEQMDCLVLKIRFPLMSLDHFETSVLLKDFLGQEQKEEIIALIKGKRPKKKSKFSNVPRKSTPMDFRKLTSEQLMALRVLNIELYDKIVAEWKRTKRIELFVKTKWNGKKPDVELREMKKILKDMDLNGVKVEKILKQKVEVAFFHVSFIMDARSIENFLSENLDNLHLWPIGFNVTKWDPKHRPPSQIKSHVDTKRYVPMTKPISKFKYS